MLLLEKELVTMPLDRGLILPGITRMSILELAKQWKDVKVVEKVVTMCDIMKSLDESRVRNCIYVFIKSKKKDRTSPGKRFRIGKGAQIKLMT